MASAPNPEWKMADTKPHALTELLPDLEGFEVATVTTEETLAPDALGLPAPRMIIALRAKAEASHRCAQCGDVVDAVREVMSHRIRDLPFAQYDTWLIVPESGLQCARCGPTAEEIPWLDRSRGMTKRLVRKLSGLPKGFPNQEVD
jgi:ribosomal protein L34E